MRARCAQESYIHTFFFWLNCSTTSSEQDLILMAFITGNSSLEPLLEGLLDVMVLIESHRDG